MKNKFSIPVLAIAGTLLLSLMAGCDGNPVDDDDHDHAEVEGLALILNGVEIYRVLEGVVSCTPATCGVTVAEGQETALITVEFLDHDGDEIHADDLDDDFSLGHVIADASIAEFEQHAGDGKWSFHVHGEAAGQTRMQLQLLHVGHADFTTPPTSDANAILVVVTP